MPKMKSRPPNLTSTLRQVRDPIIAVECRTCGMTGTYDRSELMKRHGANVTFARIRRFSAMGCDRLIDPNGDSCGTRFPLFGLADNLQGGE